MLQQRVQVRFGKKGDVRFISHLDLMRAFERALRRSGLPLRMTEGFNPHPRMSFPAPLSVGTEGDDEVMEFELDAPVSLREIARKIAANLPPGIPVNSVQNVPPTAASQAAEASYVVRPRDRGDAAARFDPAGLQDILGRQDLPVERLRKGRKRTVNIRPFLLDARCDGDGLVLRFRMDAEGTSRPEEVLTFLGFTPDQVHALFQIERTKVVLAQPARRRDASLDR